MPYYTISEETIVHTLIYLEADSIEHASECYRNGEGRVIDVQQTSNFLEPELYIETITTSDSEELLEQGDN